MNSVGNDSRKFKIEGSGRMLEALAQAIELALRAARATPYRKAREASFTASYLSKWK
jgi:hypothetical protein